MLTLVPNEHLSDGELIRFLDGEAAPQEREQADAHLANCVECRRRLDGWGSRSLRLSGLLLATDLPVPASAPPLRIPRQVPWLRAAAIVALLVGGAALASPVRAWVAQWIRQWTEQPAPTPPTRSAEPTREPVPESSTRVQFTPSADVLALEFATHQAAGVVRLEPGNSSQASVEVVRGAGDVDVLVLPDGIRVHNTAASGAEYRVVVPGSVRRLQIRIGNDPPMMISAEEIRSGRQVDLRRRDR